MNLYLVTQDKVFGWDSYSGVVVAAENEHDARNTFPNGDATFEDDRKFGARSWCDPEESDVKLIGVAVDGTPAGVVLASFNA